jgi:hypothetical protein
MITTIMSAPYTITPPTDIFSSLNNANALTSQWFGGMIILSTFIIIFTGLKMYNTEKALIVSGIVTFIVTVLLVAAGLVTPIIVGLPLLLIAVGFFVNI